jgi:ABC-type transport system involved in multi-copper enzyme maturation permease subunit
MNPVLQRELITHLRSPRTFVLLGMFLAALGLLVVGAWPQEAAVDLANPTAARRLVEVMFAGQFLLASLTAPAFAAGSLTGEKERKTYEMLLASALHPRSIVWGKWMASLVPTLLLLVSSLPIVLLCLPLGGISFYEAAAAYAALSAALACFTLISLFAGAYFSRTIAALLTSYLVVLPASLVGLWLWITSSGGGAERRLAIFFGLVPCLAAIVSAALFPFICRRLWYPPDVGSEGRDVLDEQQELRQAIGLVIRRHDFPDRLFAPAKREEPLDDDVNPVLDKELRSELFSQGTLMLRLVVQISLLTAVPIMAACLYFQPHWAPWYLAYVLAFNLLVGPAFSAGAISNERERRTLDLLLATTLSPASILWGKLLGGLRVSGVLTMFLLWPVVLACVLVPEYYPNLGAFAAMVLVVCLSCGVTSSLSLLCSIMARNSTTSLTTAYLALGSLFWLTPTLDLFAQSFFADAWPARVVHALSITSPVAAVFSLPLEFVVSRPEGPVDMHQAADWPIFWGHLAFQTLLLVALPATMGRLFAKRYGPE